MEDKKEGKEMIVSPPVFSRNKSSFKNRESDVMNRKFSPMYCKVTRHFFGRMVFAMVLLVLANSTTPALLAQSIESGCRVMSKRSNQAQRYRQNPLTANVAGSIYKVTSIEGDQLIVKDCRGMAQFKRGDLILSLIHI